MHESLMSQPLVSVERLTVCYSSRGRAPTVAVDGVDLEVRPGQTVGLVGESGSGKSSLGNALLGLVDVTEGSVHFDDEDITHADRRHRRQLAARMQVVFQDPFGSMNPVRTVRDTLTEGLRLNLGLEGPEIDQRVERALGDVSLPTTVLQRYPGQFSGGQRQRIAIARALVVDPAFLVCDEVVSALDLSVQAQVLNMLARLRSERSLAQLFISHDLSVVSYLSDVIVVMYAGRVVERGPAWAISEGAGHPYTRMLLASAPVPDPVEQAERRSLRQQLIPADPTPVGGRDACLFADRCPFARAECRASRPSLELRADGHAVACHRYDEIATEARPHGREALA